MHGGSSTRQMAVVGWSQVPERGTDPSPCRRPVRSLRRGRPGLLKQAGLLSRWQTLSPRWRRRAGAPPHLGVMLSRFTEHPVWLSERLVPPFEAACPLSAFSVPRSVLSPPESRLARGVGSVGILRAGRAL